MIQVKIQMIKKKKILSKQIGDLESKVQDGEGVISDLTRVTKGNSDKISQQNESYDKLKKKQKIKLQNNNYLQKMMNYIN